MVTTRRHGRSGVQIRMPGSVLESTGGSILASAEAAETLGAPDSLCGGVLPDHLLMTYYLNRLHLHSLYFPMTSDPRLFGRENPYPGRIQVGAFSRRHDHESSAAPRDVVGKPLGLAFPSTFGQTFQPGSPPARPIAL